MRWQAAKRGDSRMVRALLDMGAPVDHADHLGRAALHVAVRGGHLGVLGVLLKHGADANTQAAGLKCEAPVHIAAKRRFTGSLNLLLQVGRAPSCALPLVRQPSHTHVPLCPPRTSTSP